MFKSTQNFLNYRKQCFENLNSLNSLNKFPASYKKFLKNSYKKRFLLYSYTYKSYLDRRKTFFSFIIRNFFSFVIILKINKLLNNFFNQVFISFLQKRYLIYIDKVLDKLFLYINNLFNLTEILKLISDIQIKIFKSINLLEINQISIKTKSLIFLKRIRLLDKYVFNIKTFSFSIFNNIKNIFIIKYFLIGVIIKINYLIYINFVKILFLLQFIIQK